MAIDYGVSVARTVSQGARFCPTGSWVQLSVGTAPLTGRKWIRLAPRGRDTIGLALAYVAKAADGTYTAPTVAAHNHTIIPTTSIHVEPIGDSVAVFGRAQQRGGASGGIKVIITEFA